ncbi:MAG: alpha-hydroxy acid oxidase [Alphaproteobacteria bacterium]|nr:alpha-hydroxy acid oxidase [Alphaproteobacteria bacterium]
MSNTPDRRLARCHNIDDLRRAARRKVPLLIFDFVDGAAEDEVTLARNRNGFDRYQLVPHNFVDVSEIDTTTTVLGRRVEAPLVVSPTGLPRLVHHTGEEGLVPAAGKHGIPYTLSSASSTSIEAVANLSSGPKWFQIYVWKDRAIVDDFIDRCKGAGYDALCLTVDVPITGNRERDVRNGLALPPKPTPAVLFDMLCKPTWLWHLKTKPEFTLANLVGRVEQDTSASNLSRYTEEQLDKSLSWDDAARMKERWDGPFAIKGVLRAEDARRAVDLGFDGIIVSNHGGRQLDHAPAPIDVLPEIVAAVEGRAQVILDGGVRRGTDVLKALSLGATACMAGRPYLYGLGAGGQAGVERAMEILKGEIRRDLMLLGCAKATDLGPQYLRQIS